MSTADRIEELRRKFDVNPRRYFAPLANELRKAGALTEAIALCREQLPKQPGHMSAHIVFGQSLFEHGELGEARVVLEQALALDPENLIALHYLGHIAREQGDLAVARRWYERALDADPRNDAIAHQLDALATPDRPQASTSTPPSSPPALGFMAPPPTPVAGMRAVDIVEPWGAPVEPLARQALAADASDDRLRTPGHDPFLFGGETMASGSRIDELPSPIDLDAALAEGLETADWSGVSSLAAGADARSFPPPYTDVTVDAIEAFGREPGDPMVAPLPALDPDVFLDDAPGPGEPDAQAAAAFPMSDAAPGDAPAFVTETMGELLVAQGFVDRAVAVYGELVRRRPYDPVLSGRLAELREQLAVTSPTSGSTARTRFAALAARRVARRAPLGPLTPVAMAAPVPPSALVPLFDEDPPALDDAAGRAIADAFSASNVRAPGVALSDDLAQFSAWLKGLGPS